MIKDKINALFQFIEYLHSNIDNFNLNNDLIKELELLDEERQKVSSKKTFTEKLRYDEVQAEIEKKFKALQGNTANLIKSKAQELNVCNFDNEPIYSFYGIETEIHQLKENFNNKDLPEIFKHKSQYIEYRTNTHGTFLSLQFFFEELDEITKSLFDYFKETDYNEFETFETKAIQVNSIYEAVEQFQKGNKKISLSIGFQNPKSELPKPENNEPTNKVKAWVVFFEKDNSKTMANNIKHVYKNHGWTASHNTVGNELTIINRIANKIIKAEKIFKDSLFDAIPLLKVEHSEKAKKLHSELN